MDQHNPKLPDPLCICRHGQILCVHKYGRLAFLFLFVNIFRLISFSPLVLILLYCPENFLILFFIVFLLSRDIFTETASF